jgi:hypothetical protein
MYQSCSNDPRTALPTSTSPHMDPLATARCTLPAEALGARSWYSSEVQQRQPPKAAQPIISMPPDLVPSLSKLDRHEFTPKRA